MLLGKKKRNATPIINSLIGYGTRLEGNIIFSGGLRVDGDIKGNVIGDTDEKTTVVVSEHARVEGKMHVPNAIINGSIIGPVHCTHTLELQSNAQITGDVEYAELEMHSGAAVQGRLTHAKVADNITKKMEYDKKTLKEKK